jgi:hypothetical protein
MQNARLLGAADHVLSGIPECGRSENARNVLKAMLKGGNPSGSEGVKH